MKKVLTKDKNKHDAINPENIFDGLDRIAIKKVQDTLGIKEIIDRDPTITTYELALNSNIVKISNTLDVSPSEVVIKRVKRVNGILKDLEASESAKLSLKIKFIVGDNVVHEESHNSDVRIVRSQITTYINSTIIKVELIKEGSVIDSQNIAIVKDGSNGSDGQNGANTNYVEYLYCKTTDPANTPAYIPDNPNPGSHWQKSVPTVNKGEYLWVIQTVKNSSGQLLTGHTWSFPVRMNGTDGSNGATGPQGPVGPQGPPGLDGTRGPIARTFEYSLNSTYYNNNEFIDYVYYRGVPNYDNLPPDSRGYRGWLIPNKNHNGGKAVAKNLIPHEVEIPGAGSFIKQTSINTQIFGTVIAEQANIANFIFRNGTLQSQEKKDIVCQTDNTKNYTAPKLKIDGFKGIISFVEKMILDENGMVLKDNCGNPRMKILLDDGTGLPIIRFFDAAGNITWEAGQSGYKVVGTTKGTFSEIKEIIRVKKLENHSETSPFSDVAGGKVIDSLRYAIVDELKSNNFCDTVAQSCTGSNNLFNTTNFLVINHFTMGYTDPYYKKVHHYKKGNTIDEQDFYDDCFYYPNINDITAPFDEDIRPLRLSEVAADTTKLPPDGWYIVESDRQRQRLKRNICESIGHGVYVMFPYQEDVNGNLDAYYIEISYIKRGKITKNMFIPITTPRLPGGIKPPDDDIFNP